MAIVKKLANVKKLAKRGFTLIELMIVVVIIGILAALAIYGVQQYVASAKSAEATTTLGRISKDMLTFYEGETMEYAVLSFGDSAGTTRALCSSAEALPAAVPAGAKFQLAPSDFDDGEGWECLKTVVTTPVYYQYAVNSPEQGGSFSDNTLEAAEADDTFTATATGDLDGDTVLSTFTLGGVVREDPTSGDLALVLATTVEEDNPEE